MVFVEKTKDVTHQVAEDYVCVRVHFFESDRHFWLKRVQTPEGESIANYVPTDEELVSFAKHRMETPNPLDYLWLLHAMLEAKGFKIERK